MGEIVAFPGGEPEELDFAEMDEDQLRACLEELRERLAVLDKQEPADMNSEAYETWGDAHEDLEDLADEIVDRLEELDG